MGMTKQGWINRKANGNGIPWNKGKKLPLHTKEHNIKIGLAGLGNTHGFQKGKPSWNKGGKAPWTSGDKHHSWKGGITSENKKARHSAEYIFWRDAVYRKDKWICQDCGIKCLQGNIVAHHLVSFADRKDLRYVVENGQVLCRPCHARLHSENLAIARAVKASKIFSQTTVA